MNKYERRRIALKSLVDRLGSQSAIQEKTGIAASSISRMLLPEGSKHRKNIGEETVDKLTAAYPDWIASYDDLTDDAVIVARRYMQLMREDSQLKARSFIEALHAAERHEEDILVATQNERKNGR